MSDYTEQLTGMITRGLCPDCGSRGFVIGPQGGLSINIECANVGCRSRFNASFYSGDCVMAQRIENTGAWPSEPRTATDAGISGITQRNAQEALALLRDSRSRHRSGMNWLIVGCVLLFINAFFFVLRIW